MEISIQSLELAFRQAQMKGISPTIEGLKGLAVEYKQIEDPTKRAAFAMEMFGSRAGLEMQKLLELTTEELDAMAESAEAAGLIMSQDMVDAARENRLAMDNLNDSWQGFKNTLGNQVMPVLNDVLEAMNGQIATAQGNAEVIDNVRRAFAMGLITQDEYADALRGVKTGQWELNETAAEASTIMENLDAAMSDTTLETGSLSNAFKEKLVPALEDTEEATIDVEGMMRKYTTELLYNKAAAGLDAEAALGLARALGLVDERTAFMLEEVDELRVFFDLNKNGFIDAGMEADAYNTAIKQLDSSLKNLPANTSVNINVTTSGPGANLITPGTTNIGDNIQAYADGGTFAAGQPMLVGENGPELIVPNGGGTVIPSGATQSIINNWQVSMSTNAPTSTIARDLQYLSVRAI
jgi:hypothetical protein